MDIHSSNINFQSKINFVSDFDFRGKFYGKTLFKEIPFIKDNPSVAVGDNFFSKGIRTCSGGGLISPDSTAVGFHFHDSLNTLNNINNNIDELFIKNPSATSGLLIGGKNLKSAPFSVPQFDKLKEAFLSRLKNVSIFEKHHFPDEESNFIYSLKDDTWTILTGYSNAPMEFVDYEATSVDSLRKAFSKIRIAEGDELFIQGKPVTKSDAPDFFDK